MHHHRGGANDIEEAADIYYMLPAACRACCRATAMGSGPAVLRWETIAGNNPFLLHVAVQSVLQIDVEEPETSETRPFEISLRFIISSGGAHSFWP